MAGLRVDANDDSLTLALDTLGRGEPIIFPTDTVYGLGAAAFSERAVHRIYEIKRRSLDKPLALLLSDRQQIPSLARDVSDLAWKLIEHFLPGPLTLVLLRDPSVPSWVTAGGDTVAVRVPAHPFTQTLIRALGSPLATTSANLAGYPAPLTAQQAYAQLGELVSLILDGGACPGGVESTVLDVSGRVPVLLRLGAISLEELRGICGAGLNVIE
jgi:L-threonylcarbamoyladenylate synthase